MHFVVARAHVYRRVVAFFLANDCSKTGNDSDMCRVKGHGTRRINSNVREQQERRKTGRRRQETEEGGKDYRMRR